MLGHFGGWRENYRVTGNGAAVVIDGRRMPYHKGKKVDPSDVLPSGEPFENVDDGLFCGRTL